MDYVGLSDDVSSHIRKAGDAGNQGDPLNHLNSASGGDRGRQTIVSHLLMDYDDKTLNAIKSKKLVDSANTHKNLLTTNEGEIERLHSHARELETKINDETANLKMGDLRSTILQVLLGTVMGVVGIYIVLGWYEHVHAIAFVVLAIGVGYSLYIRPPVGGVNASIGEWGYPRDAKELWELLVKPAK
jgi:hypothetical protein